MKEITLCGKCRWWGEPAFWPGKVADWRNCEYLKTNRAHLRRTDILQAYDIPGGPAEIWCGPEFGCIHGEPKPEEAPAELQVGKRVKVLFSRANPPLENAQGTLLRRVVTGPGLCLWEVGFGDGRERACFWEDQLQLIKEP
jgi:hypothetical protein